MRIIYCYILSCFLLGIDQPYFSLFNLNDSLFQKIELGNIVVTKTKGDYGNGEHYQVYGIINSNTTEVFNAIKNFDEYEKFMPRLESADLIMDSDTLLSYIFNISLPMNIKYKYKIKIHMSENPESNWLAWETIDWQENSIEETWGQWYLTSYGTNNDKVLVQYQVYTDPGYIPFGFKWLVDILTKNSLPETVGNLKKWVEDNEN